MVLETQETKEISHMDLKKNSANSGKEDCESLSVALVNLRNSSEDLGKIGDHRYGK